MVAVAVANGAVEMEAPVVVRGMLVAIVMVSMVGVVVVVAILGGGGCSSISSMSARISGSFGKSWVGLEVAAVLVVVAMVGWDWCCRQC